MSKQTAQFYAIVHEKSSKARKFKPCLRVPKKLRTALEGKLNIVIDQRSVGSGSPLVKRRTFDMRNMDDFSSIKDTSGKSGEDVDDGCRSGDSIGLSVESNPSVSSFNIAKRCEFLNGIISDAGKQPRSPSEYIDRKQSTDILTEFNFMEDLKREEPRGRINKRDIEWDSEIHDIYDPEFTSESESNSSDDCESDRIITEFEVEAKQKVTTHRESLNVKTFDKNMMPSKHSVSKKLFPKLDINPLRRLNTPVNIGVVKMQVMDFKKKLKPRAMSIKPNQNNSMIKNAPQFKSRILAPTNTGSRYLSNRPSMFDMKDVSDVKKRKVSTKLLKSSPRKTKPSEDRSKIFKTETGAQNFMKRKLGSINARHNASTMSHNAKVNSESYHF